MKIIYSKKKLIKLIKIEKDLGFVPTMGALHKGHISIVKRCSSECNKTIVTIFVNKSQFNNKKDYELYPRIIKSDIYKLKKLKVDYLYIPTHKQIYPAGTNKKIKLPSFSKKLCGKFRPGHFKAVVNVIDNFLKIINPKKIYLGNKDMQQLKIIEHFVNSNYKKIKVVGCKTIREKNGLALSSRNLLLNLYEKKIASKVFKFLKDNKNKIIKKNIRIKSVKKSVINLGVKKIDYIELIDINKINKPYKDLKKIKVFIAYYVGKIRLIDNI